jgi:hypothetical protein
LKRRTRSLPPVFSPCELAAESIDADRRQVDVVFLSGQPIARTPLFADSYWLEFDITPKAANLSRLNDGGAVVDNHNHYGSVAAVLGRVERAWIDKGKARATLRFSRRSEVDGVWQDIADGILTSVSAGVFLEELEELPKHKDSDMRRFAVRRWTPYELSIVGVPADAGAKIQASADTERHPCRLTLFDDGGSIMQDDDRDDLTDELDDVGDEQAKTKQQLRAENAELRRCERIRELGRHFEEGDLWAERHIRLGSSIPEVKADGIKRAAQKSPEIDGRLTIGDEYESPGFRADAMAQALAARATGKEPAGAGRRYFGQRIVDLAYEVMKPTGRVRTLDPRFNGGRILDVSLAHGTSDFPAILGSAVGRILLPLYENAMPTYRQVARRQNFRDFRVHSYVRAGDFPVPLQLGELGEIVEGSIGEHAETGVAVTYARLFSISRQALVNDDLGAFANLAFMAATRAVDVENALFFQKMITVGSGLGPTMSDGVALFNATHGNVGSAGALDVTHLAEARQLLLNQTSIDGLKLNIPASILLVPPASQTLGEQLVAPLQPAVFSNVNPFQGRLTVLTDANLPTPGTRFYVLGDPAAGRANYLYGSVEGEVSPFIEARAGFHVDGVEVKLRLDIGFAATDWRFGATAAGA